MTSPVQSGLLRPKDGVGGRTCIGSVTVREPRQVAGAYFFSLAVGPCTGGGRSAMVTERGTKLVGFFTCLSAVCSGSVGILPPPWELSGTKTRCDAHHHACRGVRLLVR